MFSELKEWNIPDIIAKNDFVILQFGSKSCTPCHTLSQKLEKWSLEHPEFTKRAVKPPALAVGI